MIVIGQNCRWLIGSAKLRKLHPFGRRLSLSIISFSNFQARDFSRAMAAYRAIIEDGKWPNEVTRCALISRLLKGSRKDAEDNVLTALELWDDLKREAAAIKQPLKRAALETGVHVCCRGRRMQEACAIVESMHEPRVQVWHPTSNFPETARYRAGVHMW
jgi:hypothetical protein